jgi:hypothetical protein
MESLAAGGAQRCDLLPLEVENAATTTPKQPGLVSETLDLAQCFPSSQDGLFCQGADCNGEKP